MFRNLKKRLVLLYGLTSSVILTAVIIGICIISYKQDQVHIKELFQKNVEQIAEKIRTENVINNTWMDKMQTENNMIILLEDNGKQLDSYNRLKSTANLVKYKEKIKKLAAEEEIYLDRKPLYSTIMKTSVYPISHNPLNSCYGMAILIPQDNGWLSVMAVYVANSTTAFIKQVVLFAFINFLGVAALFLISSLYITKVLNPLEEGQKRQNAFVAAASHELRSPLTVIKASISSIKEDTLKANQFLPYIEGECDRMTRLISDMLLLASTDAKTWSLVKEQVDMDTLLIESYDIYCNLYNNKNYQLTLDLPEQELHMISGDKERIKQILTILVDNAMSYAPIGSDIVLRAYNQKYSVIVEVEDHGIGISEEDKNQVFERFYRADKSRNKKKHFGLGLSIAKELIELHDGDISIKDTFGGGTTFIIRLPW